ncbi:hypothetical protein LMS44_21880 [Halomonas profundus]|nr:hypothetical protein LMS44_21880 [Halomonas profundus]
MTGKYDRFIENGHTQTSLACFWMLLGSFLPIIVDSAIKSWALPMGYLDAFWGNLKGGEVFILTTAMITPFFFLLLKKVAGQVKVQFKFFSFVFIFSLISLVGGLLSFSYFRIGEIVNSGEVELGDGAKDYLNGLFGYDLSWFGVCVYGISLIVWYYASYHDRYPGESYNEAVSSSQKNLNDKVFSK